LILRRIVMAVQKQYRREFREQAVRFVFESIEEDESRSQACRRLAPKMDLSFSTLYGWVKKVTPRSVQLVTPGSTQDLQAQIAALKKENRELSRANDILKAASTFWGGARPPTLHRTVRAELVLRRMGLQGFRDD
jgi:transposase